MLHNNGDMLVKAGEQRVRHTQKVTTEGNFSVYTIAALFPEMQEIKNKGKSRPTARTPSSSYLAQCTQVQLIDFPVYLLHPPHNISYPNSM